MEPDARIPDVGETINITFTSKVTYSICGQNIVIFTVNLLTNAIIKEIIKDENGVTKILYSDTDSMPMYISCTGFITSEEAETEHKNITRSKGQEKYIGALTTNEYLRQEKLA